MPYTAFLNKESAKENVIKIIGKRRYICSIYGKKWTYAAQSRVVRGSNVVLTAHDDARQSPSPWSATSSRPFVSSGIDSVFLNNVALLLVGFSRLGAVR